MICGLHLVKILDRIHIKYLLDLSGPIDDGRFERMNKDAILRHGIHRNALLNEEVHRRRNDEKDIPFCLCNEKAELCDVFVEMLQYVGCHDLGPFLGCIQIAVVVWVLTGMQSRIAFGSPWRSDGFYGMDSRGRRHRFNERQIHRLDEEFQLLHRSCAELRMPDISRQSFLV
eukprot:ANDGO_04176.mRNA.1 hypothetical protein